MADGTIIPSLEAGAYLVLMVTRVSVCVAVVGIGLRSLGRE